MVIVIIAALLSTVFAIIAPVDDEDPWTEEVQ
jgi:hypothetical protein